MNAHIIQRQIVEVTTDHVADGLEFKDQLVEFCKQKLLPALERTFDRQAPGSKIFRCDKVTIDVGELPSENWQVLFVERVVDELTKRISASVPFLPGVQDRELENVFVEMDEDDNAIRSILYFVEHGSLPWFSVIKSKKLMDEWVSKVAREPRFSTLLLNLIKEKPMVVERLINQFGENVLEKIIVNSGIEKDLVDTVRNVWKPVFSVVNYDEVRQSKIVLSVFLSLLNELKVAWHYDTRVQLVHEEILKKLSKEEQEKLMPVLKDKALELKDELFSNKEESSVREKRRQGATEFRKPASEYWYVGNAGLAILYPFLRGLFKNVGYTDENKWINEDSRCRALSLTQYLITGEDEYAEFLLMLNKVLTGHPLEQTLPVEIVLSDYEKNEAIDLLKSVVSHWTALKNTSIDGLRSTFLMREAKLSLNENGWLLQVEQKTVDILMNKLPWGISIVKTPWMDKKMHVEWT